MADQAKRIYASVENHIAAETTAVNNGNFSAPTFDVDVDNTTDLYPYAEVLLIVDDWSAAPTAGLTIGLYRRDLDIFGTAANDTPSPDSAFAGMWVGAFLVDAVDAQQFLFLDWVPISGYKMNFYIKNNTGVNIPVTTGSWGIDVRRFTLGPTP